MWAPRFLLPLLLMSVDVASCCCCDTRRGRTDNNRQTNDERRKGENTNKFLGSWNKIKDLCACYMSVVWDAASQECCCCWRASERLGPQRDQTSQSSCRGGKGGSLYIIIIKCMCIINWWQLASCYQQLRYHTHILRHRHIQTDRLVSGRHY